MRVRKAPIQAGDTLSPDKRELENESNRLSRCMHEQQDQFQHTVWPQREELPSDAMKSTERRDSDCSQKFKAETKNSNENEKPEKGQPKAAKSPFQ